MQRLLSALVLFTALATHGCGGCDTTEQKDNPIPYRDGITNDEGTVYESGPPDGELLHFPRGQTYDLFHGLAAKPYLISTYVAFDQNDPDGENPLANNPLAETAGNQVVIEKWDDEIIRVRNDTCAEFYLRVVAQADPNLSMEE